MQSATLVIDDNKDLLELMVRDSMQGPAIYRPGQFWQHYEEKHHSGLMEHSLRDLGRIGSAIDGGFGAEENLPTFFEWHGSPLYQSNQGNPAFRKMVEDLNAVLKHCPDDPFLPYSLSLSSLRRGAARLAEAYGAMRNAKPLGEVTWRLFGNPTDVFEYRGKWFTYRALYYYMKYAFAAKHVNFDEVDVIVELGAGAGRQAAMILDLYPHITYLMFDIPTTLYFCHQFLQAVFPERVVGYEQARTMTSLDKIVPGKIYHFGSWQFPLLRGFRAPLFWNCQSFQEMEPSAVANYTSIVEEFADAAFLVHAMKGIEWDSTGVPLAVGPGANAGDYGTKYLPSFEVVEREKAYDVLGDDLGAGGVHDIFLKKRRSNGAAKS